MDLTTSYLGLPLRSPLVPSASPLSEKIENVREMEHAGGAAVVFHSLFEEQTEAATPEFRVNPATYLEHIAEAKRSVGIPIIASLNCTTLGGWVSYARRITEAGADALELNIYKIPTQTEVPGSTIEDVYVDTVRSVRAATKIPLAVNSAHTSAISPTWPSVSMRSA
jgi:dihydroorotate dehydrogenase (fumarate)